MYSKHAGGRPLKFKSVEDTQIKIDAYFKECDEKKKPYTVTGLAYALDTDRQTLINYEERGEYLDTIKKAKEKCQKYAEEQLFRFGQVAGVIFNMKNNYGWKDVQEVVEHKNTFEDMSPEQIEKRIKELQEAKSKSE